MVVAAGATCRARAAALLEGRPAAAPAACAGGTPPTPAAAVEGPLRAREREPLLPPPSLQGPKAAAFSATDDARAMADGEPEPVQLRGVLEEALQYERFEAEMADHEDHTFCGVMFDVSVLKTLPVHSVEIESISVRGMLGPMSVSVTNGSHSEVFDDKDEWQVVYERDHAPSFDSLEELRFEKPIVIPAGETRGLYVHSRLEDDTGIVYDNQRGPRTPRDHHNDLLMVSPALAHLSWEPFGAYAPWGGHSWRPRREFVGRISYGARYMMWNPEPDVHSRFPPAFRRAAETLLMAIGRQESPLYSLRVEHAMYILNMCGFDWWGLEGLDEVRIAAAREISEGAGRGFHFIVFDDDSDSDGDGPPHPSAVAAPPCIQQ